MNGIKETNKAGRLESGRVMDFFFGRGDKGKKATLESCQDTVCGNRGGEIDGYVTGWGNRNGPPLDRNYNPWE